MDCSFSVLTSTDDFHYFLADYKSCTGDYCRTVQADCCCTVPVCKDGLCTFLASVVDVDLPQRSLN